MTIHVDWGDHDETFIVMKLERYWQAADYYRAFDALRALSYTKQVPIPLLVDTRSSLTWPRATLSIFRHALTNRRAKTNAVVIIVNGDMLKRTIALLPTDLRQASEDWMHCVETVDEAYALLEQVTRVPSKQRAGA